MVNVTINIESVFSQFTTVKELKEVAQSVINQVNAAYKARLVQIQKTSEKELPAQVPVSVSSKGTKTTPKNTKQPKKTAPKVEEPAKENALKSEQKTEKKPKEEVKQVSISSLTKAQIKAMNIKFEHYSEKCMVLTGNTRCIKDEIKATGKARWNNHRQGWFVGNDAAKELAKALKIKIA